MMLSDVCLSDMSLSVTYIGPKSRTERPRKIKIGTEVAHVTRDSDTAYKVKRSKVNSQGAEAYCGGLPHSLLGAGEAKIRLCDRKDKDSGVFNMRAGPELIAVSMQSAYSYVTTVINLE